MKPMPKILSLVRCVFWGGMVIICAGIIGVVCLVFHTVPDLPKLPGDVSRIIETPQSIVYASSGQMLMRLGERESVPLSRVSADFINAILATEDHLFFQHHGINKLRTLKALYITLFKPGRVEGASTITQQLAKNLFFSFEQSYARKFKELLVALQIEATSSKEEILEAYINQIYFGAGAQGIEKAASTFFGKSAQALTLPEAALLAGLPKSPSAYNPFVHYDRAMRRRKLVLQRMVAAGFISRDQAAEADAIKPLLYKEKKDARSGSYFLDALVGELVRIYGENVVYHGGLRVYATLDFRLQEMAETAMEQGLDNLDAMMALPPGTSPRPQGALVAIETATGAVRAMVGGRDYFRSAFNRATRARRQPGSGFKPFVYYSAFASAGLHPGTVMTDREVTIPVAGAPDWRPQNFGHSFQGDMVLKTALTHSVNTIAAQLVQITGPRAVMETAQKCGIKSPLEDVFSIALGTAGVTPMEMAEAFSVFANLGRHHEPVLFWRVEDAFGRILFERIVQDQQVLDPALSYQVVDMMQAVVETGSGRNIREQGFRRPCAGKTGTTDDYNDAWFTGFTPTLCASVWTGYDRKQPMKDANGNGITGGRGAAPIWANFMVQALAGEPERSFPIPENIRFEQVDPVTGCLAKPRDGHDPVVIALKTGQTVCGQEVP
ncbi:MAG: PBP1A family penicillin-binding protein [Desulfotignum sp.]|jgi:penicillin-binding protein 1A|nr:PBP1A family penicillin-binding protein [Desulfotignum sp.]